MAVVLAGPPTPGEPGQQQQAEATSYAAIARALDAESQGAVAASDPGRDPARRHAAGDPVGQAGGRRGLDRGHAPTSRWAWSPLILALREQLDGKSGQYGVGVGALKIAPTTTVP